MSQAPTIIRDEPFGHLTSETKLERYWAQDAGMTSLTRRRTLRFDAHSCSTYSPTEYISTPFNIRSDFPDDTWIKTALREFVRTEFSDRKKSASPTDRLPPEIDEVEVSHSFLDALVRNTASEVSEIVSELSSASESNDPEEMAQQIFRLLCDPRIGSRLNEEHVDRESFIRKIAASISAQERLLLVLLGFPFKDQNMLRVADEPDRPDVGEIAFLMRLFRITQAIYQLHPYGADVVVLTDGLLYGRIFGVSDVHVHRYLANLKFVRSELNLQGAVSFISLSDLIERTDGATSSHDMPSLASAIKDHIEARLRFIFENDGDLRSAFGNLISAMRWNYNSKELLRNLSAHDSFTVMTSDASEMPRHLLGHFSSLQAVASSAAFLYAATNLMLRWTELVSKFFPDAIRCTVHAKPGQFCISRSGASFPWNGVAWADEWPISIDDFDVRPFSSLGQHGPIRKVVIRSLGMPYFFTTSRYGTNISSATLVLPNDEWLFDDIRGRPFVFNDVGDLSSLGIDDSNFTWERLPRDPHYYHRLIKFRIDHYSKYGFGVHGIWSDEQLIGQFGLQVLNETRDQVELVIYLGKEFVHKGLGRKLMGYALTRCIDAGLKSIYGVVRPENSDAIELLRRFNSRPFRSQVHFGYVATVYRIPLVGE